MHGTGTAVVHFLGSTQNSIASFEYRSAATIPALSVTSTPFTRLIRWPASTPPSSAAPADPFFSLFSASTRQLSLTCMPNPPGPLRSVNL